jgi:hypothetical protein
MRIQAVKKRVLAKRSFHIWAFFAVVLAALICSTVVGVQPVRASGCSSTDCQNAHQYAIHLCYLNGAPSPFISEFICPVPGETDDYFLDCTNDVVVGYFDCVTNNPS